MTLGLGLGLNGDRRNVRANMQSDALVPKQRLGFSGALGLGLGDFRFGTKFKGSQDLLAVGTVWLELRRVLG